MYEELVDLMLSKDCKLIHANTKPSEKCRTRRSTNFDWFDVFYDNEEEEEEEERRLYLEEEFEDTGTGSSFKELAALTGGAERSWRAQPWLDFCETNKVCGRFSEANGALQEFNSFDCSLSGCCFDPDNQECSRYFTY
jgi:hypothetical protein